IDMLVISGKDFLQVSAMNVPPPSRESEGRKGFATDAEISGSPEGGMQAQKSQDTQAHDVLEKHIPSGGAVATGLAPAAKTLQTDAGWELIFGEDVENPEVLEQHKFGLQMALLGQGTPEGFVDHEFPAQARSIDGLQGPAVRRGQETLMELLKTVDQEEEELAPDAPRCPCGRRSRQGRIQLPGAVARRPYFRCAVRACRFFSFGELPVTPEAQALSWVRLRTVSPQQMTMTGQHLVMVGRDGFRPEDARLGPECESLGNTLFVDALAVLTERPGALQKLLPNALATAGCHEIRLCIEGIWRSLLLDERLPMTSSSQASGADKKNFHELLAFGRCAGNQLWIPLLEKAYAKAHGAYQFAFPGTALHVFLEELTGAVVEQVQLGKPSRSSSGEALDPEELWEFLLRYQREGTLLCCVSRSFLQTSAPSAFAVLEMQGQRSSGRALRLRNPRVTGAQATLAYERILSLLRGTPAEASTYADGSFWVQFSDFLTAFAQVCICHASSTGGSLLHTRTFEGDFTPERGVGIRGCSLRLAAQAGAEPCELWFSLLQPIPKGARLLQPSMGQVLNDLSLVVLDASTGEVAAAALFGARQSGSCRVAL
ncbi:Capn15, partial [Symbiodinium necroappetens]